MTLSANIRQVSYFLSIVFTALVVVACSGKNWYDPPYRQAKPDNRMILAEGGPHAAIWRTGDLGIHYRYALEAGRLEMEGQIVRQGRIKHFPRLTAWVRIHFLDEEGRILRSHRLWSQRGSVVYWGIRWQFNRAWDMPPETRAIAFSYTGSAGERGVTWDFWKTP